VSVRNRLIIDLKLVHCESIEFPSGYEHGNDFVFYSAVEPDSLIAFFSALLGIFVIGLSVTVEFA